MHMEWAGKAAFMVMRNKSERYVMVFICATCNVPGLAWGSEQKGMFTGRCAKGHTCTIMGS